MPGRGGKAAEVGKKMGRGTNLPRAPNRLHCEQIKKRKEIAVNAIEFIALYALARLVIPAAALLWIGQLAQRHERRRFTRV